MLTDSEIRDIMFFYNSWWIDDMPRSLLKPYHRPVFFICQDHLKLDRVLVIKGPRRVGKTTLLYQVVNFLLHQTKRENILYLSFDDPRLRDLNFDHILNFYETKILKRPLEQEKIYFLLDEVQYLKEWPFLIKRYFDRHYPIKFIVTGSSSTLMKKGAESLAGRTVEEVLLPFSFREFVEYNTNEAIELGSVSSLQSLDISKIKRYEKKVKFLFERYIREGGFPNIFEVEDKNLWPRLVREDIIEKVIYKDLVDLYDIKKPDILEKLFYYLVSINGQILNIQNISRSLGLSREYVNRYLLYLKNAYLVFTVRKFALSLEKTLRSAEKAYIFDSGIVNSLLNKRDMDEDFIGHIIEGLVARSLYGKDYYYWRDYFEVDFIVKDGERLLPIEVKYSNIDRTDIKGVMNFADRFKIKKMIVISNDIYKEEKIRDKTISFIPAWLFLLVE